MSSWVIEQPFGETYLLLEHPHVAVCLSEGRFFATITKSERPQLLSPDRVPGSDPQEDKEAPFNPLDLCLHRDLGSHNLEFF